jgi:predicted nucleic acid-binding Zn finger protein
MKPTIDQESRLAVRTGQPPDGDWHATRGSEEKIYSYRFLGGKKGRGHLNTLEGTDEKFYVVRLKSKEYVIHSVSFTSDFGQLTHLNKGDCGHEAKIHNKNTRAMQAYYHVVVRNADGELIDCDPMISNDPKS